MGILQHISGTLRPSGPPQSMFTQREALVNPFEDPNDDFPRRWYSAREAGEVLRMWANQWLNTHIPEGQRPGGAYPDPRLNNYWSYDKTLYAAAWGMAVGYEVVNHQVATIAQESLPTLPGNRVRRAWLDLDPEADPHLLLRVPSPIPPHTDVIMDTHFQAACVLAYIYENYQRLTSLTATAGLYIPDSNPMDVSAYHQFAIALLNLEPDCKPDWRCQCNGTRARFNAPPPEHSQPTDQLLRDDVRDSLIRHEKIIPGKVPPVRGPTRSNLTFPPGRGTVWTNPNLGGGSGRTTAS